MMLILAYCIVIAFIAGAGWAIVRTEIGRDIAIAALPVILSIAILAFMWAIVTVCGHLRHIMGFSP